MNLPIQARPVMRGVDGSVAVNASYGVSASGCGSGSWCCLGTNGLFCKPCSVTAFGSCLSPQTADCALSGALPAPDNAC